MPSTTYPPSNQTCCSVCPAILAPPRDSMILSVHFSHNPHPPQQTSCDPSLSLLLDLPLRDAVLKVLVRLELHPRGRRLPNLRPPGVAGVGVLPRRGLAGRELSEPGNANGLLVGNRLFNIDHSIVTSEHHWIRGLGYGERIAATKRHSSERARFCRPYNLVSMPPELHCCCRESTVCAPRTLNLAIPQRSNHTIQPRILQQRTSTMVSKTVFTILLLCATVSPYSAATMSDIPSRVSVL